MTGAENSHSLRDPKAKLADPGKGKNTLSLGERRRVWQARVGRVQETNG
jgi:hypothetical protein